MPSVVAKRGLPSGMRLDVDEEVTIGRVSSDITIDDPMVSRRHAALRPVNEGLEIEDLGSRNGTWVNGARVRGRYALTDGDVIAIGSAQLAVELESDRRDVTVARVDIRGGGGTMVYQV